jgi:sulfopyruvate decarboxylase TPP-binding subunit
VLNAQKIITTLENNNVTHVVGVPDNGSRVLFEQLWEHPRIEVILTSREGEAYGLASGLYLGGAVPLVLIQNTGFFEAGDAFRGTAYNMGLPIVMLVGYRGYKSMEPGASRVDTAATFFEPTLKAWNIPYSSMHSDEDICQISEAFTLAEKTSLPSAVLMIPETA